MWQAIARYQKSHGFGSSHRRFIITNLPGILAFRLGIRDPQAFRVRWTEKQAQRLAGWSEADMIKLCKWVVDTEFWPGRRAAMITELSRWHAEGAKILLASGMYQPMVDKFAARLDFPVRAIGTRLEFKEGRFSGRFIGAVCNGKEKAQRVLETTGDAPILAAYSDSLSDTAMLELSQQPVAVAPSDNLAEYAHQRGWRIL